MRRAILGISRAVAVAAAFVVSAWPTQASAETVSRAVTDYNRLVVADDGAPVFESTDGTRRRIRLLADAIELDAAFPIDRIALPDDALPDGVVVMDATGLQAWLSQPTTRYGHGVLGDAIEAGGLSVRHPDGTVQGLTLPQRTVFEDRYPRIVDMDDNGQIELLVVKAYANAGGALALIDPGMIDKKPSILAEGPAIGTPNRWLNPVGVGDVDGDGRIEALVVITPHIGGTLTAYEWQGDRFVVDHELFGFSNHAIGARELALSAVVDVDGDGIAEAIVPDRTRTKLRVVTFIGTEPGLISEIPVPGGVSSRLVIFDMDLDGRQDVTFVSGGDTLRIWMPRW